MKKLFSLLALALCASLTLGAQSSIRVEAPNVVAADEQFNVTFIIEGEESPSNFSWEPGDSFQLVWGPQRGSSTSISIVNGKRSKSAQTTFTYILIPKAKGTFTLPTATATMKGSTLSSSRTTIEVVSNGAKSSPSQQGGGSSQQGGSSRSSSGSSASSATGDVSSSDLFMRLNFSRTSVVVGEPLTATLKLYQRVNIAGFEDAKFPTFNGFWSQEMQAPSNIEFHRESIDDNIYNTAVLRSWVIIPQQAGDITIDPAELVCLVNIRTQSAPRSIFDSFFEDDFRTIRKRVSTDRRTIHVSALPSGAPFSFGGGVGTFSLSTRLSKDSLSTHDAASILVTVSGKGNVSLLEAPKLQLPPDFEVYDVKVTDNTDKSTGRTSGSKTFEYPFIPRSHGEFTLPRVEYSYYDVNARKYVTLYSDEMKIKVAKSAGDDAQAASGSGQVVPGVIRKDVRDLGTDIRFIAKKTPVFSENGKIFFGSALYWILAALIAALAAAAYFVLRTVASRRSDVALSRSRGATKMARRRLSKAGEYLSKNLYSAFYEELHKALLGYASDKLTLDLSVLSRENIASSLAAAGASEQDCNRFCELLDACEYARYSPDAGHEAMSAHYDSAVEVISIIDDSMKRKKTARPGAGAAVLVALLLALPGLNSRAADNDSLWQEGVSAYESADYAKARECWCAIEESGAVSSYLYYNLGNVCFKQDDIAHSIIYFNRALRLDPSNADARFNLEYARTFAQDKIDSVPEFFLKGWLRSVRHIMSCEAWGAIALVLFALALALVLMFLLSSRKGMRKTGFYGAAALILLSLLCFAAASGNRREMLSTEAAVVVRPVTSVRSAPGAEGSKDLFILHEGTEVKVLEKAGDWCDISLPDGRQGWLQSSEIEII